MTLMVKARCPKCYKEFEKPQNRLKHQASPQRWIACSKSCNFSILLEIKYHGVSDSLKEDISKSINETYDKPRRKRPSFTSWNGYKYVLRENHQSARKDGYILEHRLVMEEYLGRPLSPSEVIHHKNGQKQDNRIENLEILSRSEHSRLHRLKSSELV